MSSCRPLCAVALSLTLAFLSSCANTRIENFTFADGQVPLADGWSFSTDDAHTDSAPEQPRDDASPSPEDGSTPRRFVDLVSPPRQDGLVLPDKASPQDDSFTPVEPVPCANNQDCIDLFLNVPPCRNVLCSGGECQEIFKPAGSPCEGPGMDPPACQQYQCSTGGACGTAGLPDGTPCGEADLCGQQVCLAGVCSPGQGLDCVDGNPCTEDMCDPNLGCVYTYTAVPCDDGNSCTAGDFCNAGACQPGNLVCQCQSDADCAASEDGDLCNGTLVCSSGSCVVHQGTVVTCPQAEGQCMVSSCNPATGSCSFGAAPNGTPCSDDDLCTGGDSCQGGACAGNPIRGCGEDPDPCGGQPCDGAGLFYYAIMGTFDSGTCTALAGKWGDGKKCWTKGVTLSYNQMGNFDSGACNSLGGKWADGAKCWFTGDGGAINGSVLGSVSASSQSSVWAPSPATMGTFDSSVCSSLGGTWASGKKCFYTSGKLYYSTMGTFDSGVCTGLGGKWGDSKKCWTKNVELFSAIMGTFDSGVCTGLGGKWGDAKKCWSTAGGLFYAIMGTFDSGVCTGLGGKWGDGKKCWH